ncbi:hypothetical protein LCGC14_2097060 [marine sediment metagenome]|uniref:Uncharacterized protein n=1 Tax=marine sediment metagenome TaxID=412755 RepID=A0A0F9EY93_9ZZZZ
MNEKVPKDLGLVVATKREALWMKVKDKALAHIVQMEEEIDINKELVVIANKIIAKEKKDAN